VKQHGGNENELFFTLLAVTNEPWYSQKELRQLHTLYEAKNQKCCMMLNFQVISEKITIYREPGALHNIIIIIITDL
jgi:hypothetical protein